MKPHRPIPSHSKGDANPPTVPQHGAATPTASALLPDTHVAIVRAERIVSGLEEAFGHVRSELGRMPRALNFISGPSRTGDIEQTIVLGAHGPFRVHLLVVG